MMWWWREDRVNVKMAWLGNKSKDIILGMLYSTYHEFKSMYLVKSWKWARYVEDIYKA